MSYTVVIQGTPINLPSTSASPNWAPGQVQFNQAVANALQFAVGTFDIPPQTYQMTANSNTDVAIPGLSFPTSEVQMVYLYYYVYRTTSTNNEAEGGFIEAIYNPNNPTNSKWEPIQQNTGQSTVTFTFLDNGQIEFSSATMAGANHTGTIGFYAKVIQQLY